MPNQRTPQAASRMHSRRVGRTQVRVASTAAPSARVPTTSRPRASAPGSKAARTPRMIRKAEAQANTVTSTAASTAAVGAGSRGVPSAAGGAVARLGPDVLMAERYGPDSSADADKSKGLPADLQSRTSRRSSHDTRWTDYDPGMEKQQVYTHGHAETVLRSHRGRTAANSAAYLIPYLRPGQSLLDVGSGPGTITADLAELVAPGRVTALESSDAVLAITRAEIERRGGSAVDYV